MAKMNPAQMREVLDGLKLQAAAAPLMVRGMLQPVLTPLYALVNGLIDTLEHQSAMLEIQARAIADMDGEFLEDGPLVAFDLDEASAPMRRLVAVD